MLRIHVYHLQIFAAHLECVIVFQDGGMGLAIIVSESLDALQLFDMRHVHSCGRDRLGSEQLQPALESTSCQ
jgi:hypothetical protein